MLGIRKTRWIKRNGLWTRKPRKNNGSKKRKSRPRSASVKFFKQKSAVPSLTAEQDLTDFASFTAIMRKYAGIRELTPTIVNEFVKKIIVHAPDKSSGHPRQKIELVWNFIEEVNLPGGDQTVERQRKGRTA